MSQKTSGLPSSRPVQSGQQWGLRAFLLVFLCILLLWTDTFAGWTATPAHAATVSNPNPTLKTPSWLQPSVAVKLPTQGQNVPAHQTPATISIPHPQPPMAPPITVPLTPQAQQVLSRDGTFELDVAAGSVSAAQIQAAGGEIFLKVIQVGGVSGGEQNGRVFLGTYQMQLLNAQGQPLSTLALAQPFTFRYHTSKAQQNWLWQNQRIDAIWQTPAIPQTSTKASATTVPAQPSSSHLLVGHEEANTSTWSVSTDLRTPASTASAPSASATAAVTPAISSSTITFSTAATTASWGKARDVDVGMSLGALDYTYPLDLPSGPGGLTPPLNLTYSSGSVNESHNPQGAATWVGEGWSLGLGSSSWDQQNVTPDTVSNPNRLENAWYINDNNGLSGQLIPPDLNAATANPMSPAASAMPAQYIWHTASESHAKVQEVGFGPGACWHVWLPDGTMEEFGCVDPARQGAKNANGVLNAYRWDLDLIVDRYGNQVRINYQRNYPSTGSMRDAVISSIEYDDPSCHNTVFNGATAQCASWHPQIRILFDAAMKPANLTNTTGCQNWTSTAYRCDDPVDLTSSKGLTIANVINTYVLNDVKVQVNGNILREYALSYNQGGLRPLRTR